MFRVLEWILQSRSGKWNKLRNDFIKENKSCAGCGSEKMLEVHHITPVSEDPTRELDRDNLIVLCSGPGNCHLVFGHLHSFNCWNPDVVSDCKDYLKKVKGRPCQKKA